MRLFAQFHAAFFHMLYFFYQDPRSVINVAFGYAKAAFTLLQNYDEALASGGGHPFVRYIVAYLSSHREKAIKTL